MCCRETSGVVDRLEDMEGYWGDFRKCDTPLRIIEAMYNTSTLPPSIHLLDRGPPCLRHLEPDKGGVKGNSEDHSQAAEKVLN